MAKIGVRLPGAAGYRSALENTLWTPESKIRQESQITIVKDADSCSATLLKNLFSTSQTGIPTVTINLMNSAQAPIETITLTNVFVTSVADGSADGDVTYPLNENVTLFCETITIADQIAKTTVTCALSTNTCR